MIRLEEVIIEEIASIRDDITWYDGISWIPEDQLSEDDRQSVYEAIFSEMQFLAKKNGVRQPKIHHSGNGHYSVIEGDTCH